MSTKKLYKVWLTVKDNFGNTKELDGGTIGIDLNQDVFDDYIKKSESAYLATDVEVQEEIEKVDSIKYSDFSSK